MFSVIIPCYNVEDCLAQTLDSVLGQTYQDFEIVIVNDGSIDSTKEVVNSYSDRDKRIKYLEQENKGVSAARNLGLSEAQKEYVYFLDADDTIEPDLLQCACEVFSKKSEVSIFSFGYNYVINDKSIPLKGTYGKTEVNLASHDFISLYLTKKIKQHLCSFVIKRECLQNIFFEEGIAYGEDQTFQLTALLAVKDVFYTSKVLFHYNLRDGSAMNSGISEKQVDAIKALESLDAKFRNTELYDLYKNYLVYVFISLWLTGVKQRGNYIYFEKLNAYSSVLKNLKVKWNIYSFQALFFKFLFVSIPRFRFGFSGRSSNN